MKELRFEVKGEVEKMKKGDNERKEREKENIKEKK